MLVVSLWCNLLNVRMGGRFGRMGRGIFWHGLHGFTRIFYLGLGECSERLGVVGLKWSV